MPRATLSLLLILILFSSFFITVEARTTQKLDVHLDPNDFVSDSLTGASRGDKVEFYIESNNPVDVYIMTNEDYRDDVIGPDPDFKYATYSDLNVSSTTFTFTIPDDGLYVLVVSNPNNQTAILDYKITYPEDEISGDDAIWCCLSFFIVIIVIILLIFFFWYLNRKRKPTYLDQYQPYVPPGHRQHPHPPPRQQYPTLPR